MPIEGCVAVASVVIRQTGATILRRTAMRADRNIQQRGTIAKWLLAAPILWAPTVSAEDLTISREILPVSQVSLESPSGTSPESSFSMLLQQPEEVSDDWLWQNGRPEVSGWHEDDHWVAKHDRPGQDGWSGQDWEAGKMPEPNAAGDELQPLPSVYAGYDDGFVIASGANTGLDVDRQPYSLRINGYGQLRHTVFDSRSTNPSLNQLQLKRARIILSGHAFSTDLTYFVQLDGRSNAGDALRLLDYYLDFDIGHRWLGLTEHRLGFKTGLYKMPFSFARWTSGKEFQFADRSMASAFFDVNRSLAWGLYGRIDTPLAPLDWEVAIFNGLVTGGAETGSSGQLDNNPAVSIRLSSFPIGTWGANDIADLEFHEQLATRVGAGFAVSTIDRTGMTEFSEPLVVDSGLPLANLLPASASSYTASLYSIDASMKYRGLSFTSEYYFRSISNIEGTLLPTLFDQGFWLEAGYFLTPHEWQVLARWSRVQGNSGTLGARDQSSDEVAAGFVRYFRNQHIKLTMDATHLNGASINSATLDIAPGDDGWLYRTQLQFSF